MAGANITAARRREMGKQMLNDIHKGSGCLKCPVNEFDCDAQYRGSRCAALRAKAGVDFDPKTNADRIRAMSDEELAETLCSADFCGYCDYEKDGGTCHYIEMHPDGIGGFPLCWEKCNGKGTALWASEIDEFCMAVTKRRFGEG